MRLICSATANTKLHDSVVIEGESHDDTWNKVAKWLGETYKRARSDYPDLKDFSISVSERDQKQIARSFEMPDFD